VRLLGEALAKLDAAPEDFMGIDVSRLRDDARRSQRDIQRLGPDRFEQWDRAKIPQIRLLGRV
jgi:hypothetical protein